MKKSGIIGIATSVALVLALLTPVAVSAQQANLIDEATTAQRSWAVQAQLASIEKNKAAFVKQLIESWAPWADNTAYDLSNELTDIAMRAPAWQLYGASLAGDLKTMINVLRGLEGAGKYINALDAPQAKSWAAPSVLGDTTASLLFTPIAPCRIADTRGSGARTGLLLSGTSRTFDLTTDAYTKGQGGATSGCTGLPSFSHAGWAINITVTGHSGNGWLQVYPYLGSVPATSLINFFTSGYAIANNGHVTGCYGCSNDITILAGGGSAHVIIDVMGYYERGPSTGSAVTRLAGTPVNIAAGSRAFAYGGNCPAGTVMIGGENDFSGSDLAVGETRQDTATRWVMWQINNDAVARTTTVYSRCMDQPLKLP